jgi:hypothetical protein
MLKIQFLKNKLKILTKEDKPKNRNQSKNSIPMKQISKKVNPLQEYSHHL